jgi:hypothetical protein
LHAGAYWLLWSLRALMPKRSSWRVAQFDTLRLRLIKIAARIVDMKTKINIHLPTSADTACLRCLARVGQFQGGSNGTPRIPSCLGRCRPR